MKKEKHSIVPAVYLIFEKNGKVLLSLRKSTGYQDGKYSMVSGHVEKGEGIFKAAAREAKEEAGVTIAEKDLTLVHTMFRVTHNYIDFFLVVKKFKGKIQNKEVEKCAGLEYFDKKKLPKNVIPYVKKAIQYYMNKKTFSEYYLES